MPSASALFSFRTNTNDNHTRSKSKPTKNRRSRSTIEAPCISPRESSLYSNNFQAAASVSCLAIPSSTSANITTLYSPTYTRRNLTSVDLAKPSFRASSPSYRSDTSGSSSGSRPSSWNTPSTNTYYEDIRAVHFDIAVEQPTKPFASVKSRRKSAIGLIWSKMNKSRDDVRMVGHDEWTSEDESMTSTIPPPVPTRSKLRPSAPITSPTLPTPSSFAERKSSLYQLPVDPPMNTRNQTPSLSSASSDDGFASPEIRSPRLDDGSSSWGRKKRENKDPLRIRDGAMVRESTSGVYTPPTFPGAQGPRPSHFPSHVYTPPNFQLYPVSPTIDAGPSRSSSMSSTSANSVPLTPPTPYTPTTPTFSIAPIASSSSANNRWTSLSSGFKRISSSIASLDPRSSGSTTPSSARESYFPSISSASHNRNVSWSSGAPTQPWVTPRIPSAPASAGLGLGWSEVDALSPPSIGSRTRSASGTGDAVRGKRKPVPKVEDFEAEFGKIEIRDDGVVHAL